MSKFYVTLTSSRNDDEFVVLTTTSEAEAVERAQDEQYYIERDNRKGDRVEIRVYREDIEDEDCECFDYDLVEF